VEDDVVPGGAPVIPVVLAPPTVATPVTVVEEAVEDCEETETEAMGRVDERVVGDGPRRGRLLIELGRVILIPYGLYTGKAVERGPCVHVFKVLSRAHTDPVKND
jgi:hypothetical protein